MLSILPTVRPSTFPLIRLILGFAAVLLLSACSTVLKHPQPLAAKGECVVLVHGLWRSRFAMQPVESYLLEQGYATVNVDYPSAREPLETIAREYLLPAIQQCEGAVNGAVHIVSHSLGGIVARTALQDSELPKQGRIVMLSPPNQGSELVDQFKDWPLADLVIGPAALSLAKDGLLMTSLEPLQVNIGIITGNSNNRWVPFSDLPEPHDGTVTVEGAKLDEMDDFLVVDENHVSIRRNPTVLQEIVNFLENGHFSQSVIAQQHVD